VSIPSPIIEEFLAAKRIAVVGVSREPGDLSRLLVRALRDRRYEVVPVNPLSREVDGLPCAARVQDIRPPVEAALLMTPPAVTEQVVRDCAEAGIRRVWMHRGGGAGAVSPEAVEFCRRNDMQVVAGECPFMFLPGAGWIHRVHRFFRRFGR
jgi:predicted CoA-binding protein